MFQGGGYFHVKDFQVKEVATPRGFWPDFIAFAPLVGGDLPPPPLSPDICNSLSI